MKKLLKNPLFLFIFGAIAATIIGYLINQLPAIPDFPYKTEILFTSVVIFTMVAALVAYWQAQQQPENAPSQIDHKTRSQILQGEVTKVTQRLLENLHDPLLRADLQWEEQPERVGTKPLQTWCTVSVNNQTSQSQILDRVVDIFRRDDIGGRLLILGQPGGGKTTTLFDLAQELGKRAKSDENEPLPIIFELSAWRDDSVSILDWLVQQLKQEYNVQPGIGQVWLERGEILPLLDGLDELGLQQQRKCICAINQYLEEDAKRDLVVCCREEEYLAGKEYQEEEYLAEEEHLYSLHGAICLQPLSDEQIRDYVTGLQREDLWDSIQNNPEFLELARTPLFLSMIVIVYQGRAIQTKEELFTAYIDRRFELLPVGKGENRRQIIHYLRFLAQRLKGTGTQTKFLIEDMQPSWLQNSRQIRLYELICGVLLISGTALTLVLFNPRLMIHDNNIFESIIGILLSPFVATVILIIASSFSYIRKNISDLFEFIEPLEGFKITIPIKFKTIKSIVYLFIIELLICFLILISEGLYGLIFGIIMFFYFNLIGCGFHLYSFKSKNEIEIKTKLVSNQGIWFSLKNSIFLTVLFMISFRISIILLTNYLQLNDEKGIPVFQFPQMIILMTILLLGGGKACIQHFSLRLVLYCNGYIPWNYAKFLSRAVERRFIQQVGGRYRSDFSRDVEKVEKVRDYKWRTIIISCTWKFPQVNLVIPA